jgi:hypothetical protein
MHPLLARLDHAAAYFGASLVTAVLVSASLAEQGANPLYALLFVVPTFLVYAFVCLSAWYVCRAVPLATGGLRGVATASGVAALLAGGIWLALAEAWLTVLRAFPGTQEAAAAGADQVPFLFAVAIILFLLVLSIHHVALAYEAARDAERQRLEFQVLNRDAELRALRAQLNPHFLYNSLNSISALTTIDADGARRMCVLLGDFLRNTLKVSALDRISLADELALVDAFLAIEQIRFGPRLRVERQVDETALACRVPPLLLQPLMENAIGHGIAGLLDGGVIQFAVSRRDDRVVLRIENPRDADVAPRRSGGVGLENVRRRVQTAFGDRARIEAVAAPETFRVELNLPCVEV